MATLHREYNFMITRLLPINYKNHLVDDAIEYIDEDGVVIDMQIKQLLNEGGNNYILIGEQTNQEFKMFIAEKNSESTYEKRIIKYHPYQDKIKICK